jgi:hypothetical protein
MLIAGRTGIGNTRVSPTLPSSLKARRYRGEISCTDMHVGIMYGYLVGYAVQEFWDEDGCDYYREPIGTIFFVHSDAVSGRIRYAVTCRHVIEAMYRNGATKVFVRVNMQDGAFSDFETGIDSWTLSDSSDVAVIRFDLPTEPHFWSYPVERNHRIGLMEGMDVFFVGMFSELPEYTSVRAIVRTGTIAKVIASIPLRFKSNPDEVTQCAATLVELRSFGGESGSPVFAYDSRLPPETQYARDPGYGPGSESRPILLGLLHGYFEIARSVTRGTKRIGETLLNSGIGVVIGIGEIRKAIALVQ